MQKTIVNGIDIYENVGEIDIKDLVFPFNAGDRIFFYGDLGAGKSTFIRELLRSHFGIPNLIVRSPTYTYYQRYTGSTVGNTLSAQIYHFDLYRLESLVDFTLIGGEDIIDDPETICLIEWPEILGSTVLPTRTISLSIMEDGTRRIEIATHQAPATV